MTLTDRDLVDLPDDHADTDVVLSTTVSGRMFSAAWLAVAPFASDDDGHPNLFRAVTLEADGDNPLRLSLTASDTYALACSTIETHLGDPERGNLGIIRREDVEHRLIVADPDRRALALLKHVRKITRNPEKHPDVDVHVLVRRVHEPHRPALTDEFVNLSRLVCVIEAPGERVELPVIDAHPIDARTVLKAVRKATERIAFRPEMLKLVGSLPAGLTTLMFDGPRAAAQFEHRPHDGTPLVLGVLMPVPNAGGDDE